MKGEPISRPIAERDYCRGAIAGTMRITELKGRARTYTFAGLGTDRQVDCEKFITRKKGDWVEKTGRSGGAVKGLQIDVFTGSAAKNPLPGIVGSSSRKRFDGFLIDDSEVRDYLLSLHQRL